jgi:hypothetical protein
MTSQHLSRIGGGAAAGTLVGILLHVVFGISLFPAAPRKVDARAEVSKDPGPGILEKERLASAHQKRAEELSRKVAAAEQECADLKTRIAAVPVRPPENSREAKIRKFGVVMVRMVKIGALRNSPRGTNVEVKPEIMAETQRLMGELLSAAGELGINLQDQRSLYHNPELVAGIFEGILSECGVATDDAQLQEWRSRVADRISSRLQSSTNLSTLSLALGLQEEFLDRFGLKLMEREPLLASLMGNLGTANSVSAAETTVLVAGALFLNDLSKFAGLDEAQTAALRPSLQAWAAEYAQILTDARAKYGDGPVDGLLRGDLTGKTAEEKFTQVRNRVKVQAQLLQLESRTLEAVAGQVTGDAAKRVLKFEKLYYFARVKP